MAERGSEEPTLTLETWAVATFDVVTFGLVLVIAGHTTGALSWALPDVGTLPGIAVFGYLWLLTVLVTRWALGSRGLDDLRGRGRLGPVSQGATAGGLVGIGFVLGVVLVGGLVARLTGGFPLVTLGIVSLLGSLVGGVVGALVGTVFALLDVGFLRIADWAMRP